MRSQRTQFVLSNNQIGAAGQPEQGPRPSEDHAARMLAGENNAEEGVPQEEENKEG